SRQADPSGRAFILSSECEPVAVFRSSPLEDFRDFLILRQRNGFPYNPPPIADVILFAGENDTNPKRERGRTLRGTLWRITSTERSPSLTLRVSACVPECVILARAGHVFADSFR